MKMASVADVKARLSEFVKASVRNPVVLTRNGQAVAVLLGIKDDDELERVLLAYSPRLQAILDAADRRIDAGEGIEHDEFWRRLEVKNRRRKSKAASRTAPN